MDAQPIKETPAQPVTSKTCTHPNAKIAFIQEHEFEVDFIDGEVDDHREIDNSMAIYFDFYCVDCNLTETYNRVRKTVPLAVMTRFNEAMDYHRDC